MAGARSGQACLPRKAGRGQLPSFGRGQEQKKKKKTTKKQDAVLRTRKGTRKTKSDTARNETNTQGEAKPRQAGPGPAQETTKQPNQLTAALTDRIFCFISWAISSMLLAPLGGLRLKLLNE